MTDKKHYASSWQLEPTVRQLGTITRLMRELGIPAMPAPTTRWEAKRRIYELKQRKGGQG